MKKPLFLLAILCMMSAVLKAQSNYDGTGFRFGIQASPSFSWMRTDDKKIEGAGTNWGVKIGALGEYYFTPNYAFFGGLGFGFNQGGTLQSNYERGVFWPDSDLSGPQFDTLSKNAKLHYRINFVEIPFGFKMRTGTIDQRLRYYAEIPVFTLGFRTKAIGDIRGTNNQNTEDEDIGEDVGALALSWGFGGGVELSLGESGTVLMGGIAFQSQFTDITGDNGSIFTNNTWNKENSKGTINTISVRLGIFF